MADSAEVELHDGDIAPDFEMTSDEGKLVHLSELHGTDVVLYFYPKDDTPGCTTEACSFRDNLGRLNGVGAQVYGVSPDSVAAHVKFRDKYDLTFPLLSDEGAKTATAYGVWKSKTMFGKNYMGNERTTFLIDKTGHIAHIWQKVKPDGHAQEVIDYITAHKGQ